MKVVEIGKTAEGRPQLMAIITSPENHKKLDRYKEISRRLALAEGLTDEQARALAQRRQGRRLDRRRPARDRGARRAAADRDGLPARQPRPTPRRCASSTTWSSWPSTRTRTAWSWCRAGTCARREPTQRSTGGLPRLYQKYIGHDNNRDFYMSTQPESTNMNRVMYREWFPQIMYNHHQTGPAGTVMFAPPFRDPFNYNFDPLDPGAARSRRRGDAQPVRRGGQAGRHQPHAARATRRGGTAACGRRPTSTT